VSDISVIFGNAQVCSLLCRRNAIVGVRDKLIIRRTRSLVIEDALEDYRNGIAPRPIFFYCSRNHAEPLRSDPTAILGSIARQLANLSPSSPLLPPVVKAFEAEEEQGGVSGSIDFEDSQALVLQLINIYPVTTIIIDALDECSKEARRMILDFVKTTLAGASSLVKFFLSSREDGDIVFNLKSFPNLQISSGMNQADIETFVKVETQQLIAKGLLLLHSQSQESLEKEIVAQLATDADGMLVAIEIVLECC